MFKYAGYFLRPSVRVYKKNLAKYNLSLFNFEDNPQSEIHVIKK